MIASRADFPREEKLEGLYIMLGCLKKYHNTELLINISDNLVGLIALDSKDYSFSKFGHALNEKR